MPIANYIVENENPAIAETIRLTPITERISPTVHHSDVLLGLGLVLCGAVLGAALFGASMFSAGWVASTVYRTIQPYIEARGSYAVFAICFAIPVLAVWRGNHKIAGDWPEGWL